MCASERLAGVNAFTLILAWCVQARGDKKREGTSRERAEEGTHTRALKQYIFFPYSLSFTHTHRTVPASHPPLLLLLMVICPLNS